jgi:PAS domain S-box-containing protein/putative nucleotidyltransferase with HDIG domain
MNNFKDEDHEEETGHRILILEDNEKDLELVRYELNKVSDQLETLHVVKERDFTEALKSFRPHIILSDFCLPDYDGFLALDEVRKTDKEIPFIFVSGAIGEELAIEALRRGATDCINKNHLGKLPSSLKRVMAETDERKQLKRTSLALEKLRSRNNLILDSAGEGILGIDNDLSFIFINRSGLYMLGYDMKEIIGSKPDLIIKDELNMENFRNQLNMLSEKEATGPVSTEIAICRKDGTTFPSVCTVNSIIEEEKRQGFVLTINDISERIRAKEEIQKSYDQLRKILFDSVYAMSHALEFRDPYTAGHQMRVSELATAISEKMGLEEEQISGIYLAAIVHDIGKIYVPSEILTRPVKLTENEFKLIQAHSEAGFQILNSIEYPWPISEAVYQHHERLDGSGYPRGLTGDQIILEARIISVADVVEAMASHRPYRAALGIDKALEEITKNEGRFYYREAVRACVSLFDEGFAFKDHKGL